MYFLFAVVGIAVVLSMLRNLLMDYNTSNLIGFVVFSCIFGGVFGYFLGIRNIIYALRRESLIKRGQFWLVIDEVIEKRYCANGSSGAGFHKDFQLVLKKYTAKTKNRIILRNRKEFNAVREGAPCVLGFTKMNKRPFCVFAGSQYELAPELQSKIVEDIK